MRITDMLAGAAGSLIAFLPNLLAALIILGVGLLVASLLSRLTARLLEAVGLDRRRRVRQFVGHEETLHRLPHTVGRVVYWLVALITIGLAIDALKLTWLSAGVAAVLAYMPSIIAAAIIVAVGYFVGNFVYRKVAEREEVSTFWASFARAAILVFAGFMAVQELGIATAIVTTAFTLVLGAMAVAAAVAFGLGNRELAGRITQDWYDRRAQRRFRRPDFPTEDRLYPQH